jgi:mannose-6-phosphate isomerase-like protein (cupin superfamily)
VQAHGDPEFTPRERILLMSHTADIARDHKIHAAETRAAEKSVSHVPPGGGARSLWVFNELVTHKIPSQRTGGAYAHFEVATRPGAGPPPHVHHREDESFYVIEGEYEFLIDGRTVRVGAGSLLYFPKGTLHAHRGVGESAGRMLLTQTPGGLYERFFEEAGRAVEIEAGPRSFVERPDAESIVATAAKYGIEIAAPAVEGAQPDDASRAAAP